MILSSNLGFPRGGKRRELKRACEAYWAARQSFDEVVETARELRRQGWQFQQAAGLDIIPSNDFSLYDHVLDCVCLVGAVPPRYRWDSEVVDADTYFAMARGAQRPGLDVTALEMTKWFDTNYHYLVPEFYRGQEFRLGSTWPFDAYSEAKDLGIDTQPVLLGPISFLLLGKAKDSGLDPLDDLLEPLVGVYQQVIQKLAELGVARIQVDEPCLVQDRSRRELDALRHAYGRLAVVKGTAQLVVQTYFGHVGESYPVLAELPVDAVGLDFVRGRRNLELIRQHGWPAGKQLVGGVVDGRNIWACDLSAVFDLLEELRGLTNDQLCVSPSCSLMFVPLDVEQEAKLDPELKSWLAFAQQKVSEVVTLTRALNEGREAVSGPLARNRQALDARRRSPRTRNPEVRQRVSAITADHYRRKSDFATRRALQRRRLDLPSAPTTTIGSLPQTAEIRRLRRQFRSGEISKDQYEVFLKEQIAAAISLQEEIGIDVLVHGEFERTDMVEYFGQQLEGFAFTQHGWVQSYGSRYVKPPIIFGDVSRPHPMTVDWARYAQSLTRKPVKGMLTGPVTMLNWSFVRDDQPRSDTCRQTAAALCEEVQDLEAAGLAIIQVDEPALREGLPLRQADRKEYLDWAVACFRLATSGVRDETQIHTHMCYSEFNDIIEAIEQLDADVLSIENSRSDRELLEVFKRYHYSHDIGPGVYDIHSPRVPSVEEMVDNLRTAASVLGLDQIWVNPDCGLKTRDWKETVPSLKNMVEAAKELRAGAVS